MDVNGPSLIHSLRTGIQNIPIGSAWVIVFSEAHFSRIVRILLTEEGEIAIGQAKINVHYKKIIKVH